MTYGLPPSGPYDPPPDYGPSSVCPQCGSNANVHAIQELAALARMQLDRLQQATMMPPQPRHGSRSRRGDWQDSNSGTYGDPAAEVAGDVAGAVVVEGMRLIGRAIGRRVQRTVNEQVMPVMMDRAETQARERIAIAQQHPDLRACFTDQVAFLAGGSRVAPLPDLGQITMASADALVATLRNG